MFSPVLACILGFRAMKFLAALNIGEQYLHVPDKDDISLLNTTIRFYREEGFKCLPKVYCLSTVLSSSKILNNLPGMTLLQTETGHYEKRFWNFEQVFTSRCAGSFFRSSINYFGKLFKFKSNSRLNYFNKNCLLFFYGIPLYKIETSTTFMFLRIKKKFSRYMTQREKRHFKLRIYQ